MKRRDFGVGIGITLFSCLSTGTLLSSCALLQTDVPSSAPNPKLSGLPEGRWETVHQQHPGDAVTFKRQRHGGSTFDTRRGQLVLFGSDTHDVSPKDWVNCPFIFDMRQLEWRRPYAPDPVSSYRVGANGLPVAGPDGDHPWAMHTFGAVTYDPSADAIVVASYPAHLEPGRFTSALAPIWAQVQRHPTWLWYPESGQWAPLREEAVHFFANAIAYDSLQHVVLGYRNDGIYALRTSAGRWQKVVEGGLLGWGNNVVFDTENGVLINYGSHRRENVVVVFDPMAGLHCRMPTLGPRPPGSCYVPMAFHAAIGKTIVLISRPHGANAQSGATEAWLYDYTGDSWMHLEDADLPFDIGMNYNLEYDPTDNLLLLVATPPDETFPAVWALNLGEDL